MNTFPRLLARLVLALALIIAPTLPAAAGTFVPEWNAPKPQTAVTVGATATALVASPDNTRRRVGVWIQPTNGDIWIGDSTVTTSKGIKITSGTIVVIENTYGALLYAVRDGSSDVTTQVTLWY